MGGVTSCPITTWPEQHRKSSMLFAVALSFFERHDF